MKILLAHNDYGTYSGEECGATNELVKDGVNGVVFNPLDDNDIKLALEKFIKCDISDLSQMGEESLRIIANWDLSLLANETLRAIEYVLSVEHRKCDCITKLLLKVWRGRYNQI